MTFEVEPASLRQADQDLGDLIQRAVSQLERFEADLAAQGEPWGNDDIGSVIGELYRGAYAMAMNCFNSNLDTIDAYGEKLGITAESYEVSQQDAAAQLDQVKAIVGSVQVDL